MFAVIMAGGAGKRFWPLSRSKKPKQLLTILGRDTLLKQTVERLHPLIPGRKTIVLTSKDYYHEALQELPHIPGENIVAEPVGRNTAPCIALGAIMVKRYEQDAAMVLIPADHYIGDAENFRKALGVAGEIASRGEYLITLGVKPERPDTAYGYVQKGERLFSEGGFEICQASRFVEKPNAQRAKQFFQDGGYLWNSGIFILTVKTANRLLEKHMPSLHRGMLKLEEALSRDDFNSVLSEVYKGLESISIDYGVAEKASHVFVIPVSFGWSDVGSWKSLYELLPKEDGNNAIIGSGLCMSTTNSLIYSSGRLITTIGLKNMVVIDSGDSILVCRMRLHQKVKKLVELMERKGMGEYL